jgi:hypothetical protein
MRRKARVVVTGLVVAISVAALAVLARSAWAHCDTLGGPVVMEAKTALEKGDVTPVLKWVRAEDEGAIRKAFQKVLVVRTKGPEARELADMYFFETLVRIHRAGEGEPYTGLKPAGTVEPPVAAADKALEEGSVDALAKGVAQHAAAGVRERFERALEAKKHMNDSVDAGRAYVRAYVEYIHYVENLHNAIAAEGHAHGEASEAPAHAH